MKKEISLKLKPVMTKREYLADLFSTGNIMYTVLLSLGMALGGFVLLALVINDLPWGQELAQSETKIFSVLAGFYVASLIITFLLSHKTKVREDKAQNTLDIKRFESILQFFPQAIDYLLDSNGEYSPRFWIYGAKYPLENNLKVIFNYRNITFISPDYDIIFNLEERRIIMDDIVTNNFTEDEIKLLMIRLDAAVLSLGTASGNAINRSYEKNIQNLRNMLK